MIPYGRAKTLAERAAWRFVSCEAPTIRLTVIHPGAVFGPPLGTHYGASIQLIERLLRGRDPMLPRLGVTVVDVRDVAEAHLRALERPESAGHRILLLDRFVWAREIARALKDAYPELPIATREAPDLLVRVLALFDRELRAGVSRLGRPQRFSNARARELLGLEFIPALESARASADWLVEQGVVR
jgi:dihydroflavonol-4-reductase